MPFCNIFLSLLLNFGSGKESTCGRFVCQDGQQQMCEKWGCLFWFFMDDYCYYFDSLPKIILTVFNWRHNVALIFWSYIANGKKPFFFLFPFFS